jgi:conjugal transfer mating pair stabilization protein TraN
MRSLILLVVIFSFINHSLAGSPDFESAVNLAKSEAQNKKSSSYNQAKNFDPKSVFDNYTNHPNQTKYYDGVKQSNTQQMTNDAFEQKNGDEGKVISNTINQHPRYVINPSDPDMQHSQLIQNEADNIIHGVTSRYVDCKPKQSCAMQYQTKQCTEAPQTIFQSCKKKLIVDVITHESNTHYPLTAHLSVDDHNYAGISMNTVNGRIDFLGPHDASFRLDGRLPGNIDCHTLQGSITRSSGNARLDNINLPSCGNGLGMDFHISGGHRKDLQIDMVSKVVTYEVKDRWVDDCSGIISDTTCKLKSQQCDVPKSTQVIQGIPVTRDCWQESFSYICRGGSGAGDCSTLRTNNCEQIGSDCKEMANGQCSLYQQTYRCPIQSCSPTTDVICGNGQEYCLDGSCTDHSYNQSQDFAKGVSALSAVADAAKQLDQSSLSIFTGRPVECSEKPVGYSNCCTETGWGQDIGLDNCSEAEKKLHVDRDNKLTIKVGRYCSSDVLGVCVEHSQVFCVFNSKLAKIIQEQGRSNQLHINFGDPEHPRCNGITPEQLQALNLSTIDFQDFINDLSKNVKNPDLKQIQDMIKQHVKQAQTSGRVNG